MTFEIDENIPEKPSLRKVQTKHYGIPKDKQYKVIQDIARAHVDSFNFACNEGLRSVIENIPPLEVALPNEECLLVELTNCVIREPCIKLSAKANTLRVYPRECRERGVSYKGDCIVRATWSIIKDPKDYMKKKRDEIQKFDQTEKDKIQKIDQTLNVIEKKVGEVPIMVKSARCNLYHLSPKQLIAQGEEEQEFGGYFIINGLEKVVRLLIMQRRNYPIAMQRGGWKKRGDLFTEFGISIRSVRSDQSGSNLVLHYLSDGTVKLMFTYKKALYFIPVMLILKALVDEADSYICNQLIKNKENDAFYKRCITNMLRQISCNERIAYQNSALNYLGEKFRVKFDLPPWYSNIDAAKVLIKQCICVHLNSDKEKFDLLVFMIQKLFAVVRNECALESPDNPMNQEILLPGHFYMIVLKEKLHSWLSSIRFSVERKLKTWKNGPIDSIFMKDCLNKSMNLTRVVENVFSTGNFLPNHERSLMQFSGLVTVADKLNFWRYLSHFRAVHRGAFFAQMRTTTVRKLLPEAWGFLCPVHTPDGTPCGLLNHMSSMAQVVNEQPNVKNILNVFCRYGMVPYDDPLSGGYIVIIDGKVVGWLQESMAHRFVLKMRKLKSLGAENIPKTIEIGFVPKTDHASQYPGLFVFTNPARLVRPVKNLITGANELIGTMEQVYLHVALKDNGIIPGVTFHQELGPTNMLSVLGNQIPFSDFNQSPRNMYECQMGKQTMGSPCHSYKYRADNKLYRILTPQSPIVRPKMHDYYHMDDYPLGTNAVVAVISYTGFDMEDAIVLNKASVERGFKHGTIYKTQVINLRVIAGDRGSQKTLYFGRDLDDAKLAKFVDEDGLPYIGTRLNYGDPICCYIDSATKETVTVKYKSTEEAYVDDVKLLGNDTGTETNQQICVKFRVPRNPIIGDKFASRHGQKGICSLMLHTEDMPFTESGMTPDIIFNPHGFPSRMTIGMMIESMAGKSASVEGVLYDATPFQYSENDSAVEYFGECLKKAGYDYYGTERMYSGVDGRELEANIFIGIVYYQRLRHMVSDKYQVRTTGPVEPLTRQPVKGRKNNGGIRFGEMERDSLIAHGSSVLLYDRLFRCSDGCQQYACTKCESLLSPMFEKTECMEFTSNDWLCKVCGTSEHLALIDIPYVFRYLCVELAAMNIKTRLKIGNCVDDY